MLIDEEFEEKVLACLFRCKDFAAVATKYVKAKHFKSSPIRQNMAAMALKFFADYRTTITAHAFVLCLKELAGLKKIDAEDGPLYGAAFKRFMALDVSDHGFVLDQLITFIRDREIRKFIEDAVKKDLPKGDYDALQKGMRAILDINTVSDADPVEFWDDAQIEARLKRREDEKLCRTLGISTGIKRLDDALDKKGWYKKELYVALGSAKAGKSMFMLWCANAAVWQGFNVVYFTCETSTERLSDRMDAMNTDVEIKFLPDNCKEVADKIRAKKPDGKMFFFEYPTKTLTPAEIERQIDRLEARGIVVDFIVVDYADIMRPQRHYEDRWAEQASVYEDLRGIAGKLEIPVLTASQVGRQGSGKTIVKGKDTAGAWEKIAIVDGCLTLCGSDEDMKKGEMLVHLSEFRNSPSCTLRIKTSYGMGRFYREFVEEV